MKLNVIYLFTLHHVLCAFIADETDVLPHKGVAPTILDSCRSEFTAKVTWQVFRITFEVYDVRFQRGEVGFHVGHLPESF